MSTNALVIPSADFSANKLTTVAFGTVPCTGISLSDSTLLLTSIGGTATLTATLTPANTTDTLSWASSDNNVASVANGVITAVGLGSATITATCGEQTETCAVSVVVVPVFNVIGGASPRKGSGNNAMIDVVTTSETESKYGAIGFATDDTNVKTIDRVGDSVGDYRLCPIKLPSGAKRVKIESKKYSGSTLLTFKTRFSWFNSTVSDTGYTGAKCLAGTTGSGNWDQDTLAASVTYDIPEAEGIDSFACALYMSDYSLIYNHDYASDFEVTILPAAEE